MRAKTMIAVAATVAVVGGIYAWMEYDRGHTGTADRPVMAKVLATDLYAAFQMDEVAATKQFVGATEQVIEVSGTIRSIDRAGDGISNVVLATDDDMAGVVCEFNSADLPKEWAEGASVTLRGICTGMLMDVVLVRCVAVV
jgi:hypothetical protein